MPSGRRRAAGGGRQGVVGPSSVLTCAPTAGLVGDQETTWLQKETEKLHQRDLQTCVAHLKKLICKYLNSPVPS